MKILTTFTAVSRYFLPILLISAFSLTINPTSAEAGFKSSSTCKKCHEEIYQNWKKSLHALSFTDPIFVTAYQKAYTNTNGEAKRYCLNCHAPIARFSGDVNADQMVTREGITCDFCHSVESVDLKNPVNPFTVNPDGPISASVKGGGSHGDHKSVYTKDFASSELCAGCHDFKNRLGAHVGSTYTEWRSSPYAKDGTECQDCHMKPVASNGGDKFPDHSLGRTLDSLRNAVTLKLVDAMRQGNRIGVKVAMTNSTIGHAAPTGTPMRRLALEVKTYDARGTLIESQKREYGKTVLAPDGGELYSDGEVFMYGKTVAEDTSLQPMETRTEKFVFSLRSSSVRSITADVYFLYQPVVRQKIEMRIPLSSADATIK